MNEKTVWKLDAILVDGYMENEPITLRAALHRALKGDFMPLSARTLLKILAQIDPVIDRAFARVTSEREDARYIARLLAAMLDGSYEDRRRNLDRLRQDHPWLETRL